MSEQKHTPGPWITSGEINARYLRGIGDVILVRRNSQNDDRYLAMVSLDAMGDGYTVSTSIAEREANARLIAAAPDLYDAIRNSDDAHWTPAMRAAMAKAEGRS